MHFNVASAAIMALPWATAVHAHPTTTESASELSSRVAKALGGIDVLESISTLSIQSS